MVFLTIRTRCARPSSGSCPSTGSTSRNTSLLSEAIVAADVEAALRAPLAGPVVWFDEIGSTNDEAGRRAELGAAEGLVVGAEHQRAGRGRRGRTWHDDTAQGLTVSVLLRPGVTVDRALLLPLVAAVAVADMVDELGAGPATIVWPNDVLVGGRKVAGVLCELSSESGAVHHVIVGVGVNVRSTPAVKDARWTPGAISTGAVPVSREQALVVLLAALNRRYTEWSREPAATIEAFRARDGLLGMSITVDIGRDEELQGRACGIDAQGRLLLEQAHGRLALGSGEVVRLGV